MNPDHAKRALDFLADMIRFKSYSGTPGEGEPPGSSSSGCSGSASRRSLKRSSPGA